MWRVVARSHAGVDRNIAGALVRERGWPSPAHTRAWIETRVDAEEIQRCWCRPLTRGRGSKRRRRSICRSVRQSPAHTRAWIETTNNRRREPICQASPAHTRAWIETNRVKRSLARSTVARSHAGVDRNTAITPNTITMRSRPLTRGRGSKHGRMPGEVFAVVARSHAGVDRNFADAGHPEITSGRPLTRGRGSKRPRPWRRPWPARSPAHTRAWIETSAAGSASGAANVARSHAGVDRNNREREQPD